MISFFKKIRKRAVENNNLKRVILYALGEIFLVVIGILIAVNINNWNKERGDKQATKASLVGLVNDLQKDSSRFSFLETQYLENTIKCDSLLALLELPDLDPHRVKILKYDFIRFFALNPSTAAFDEIKNSGKLYALSNTTLSTKITRYYTDVSRNERYIANGHERIRHHMDRSTLDDYWLAVRKENNVSHTYWIRDKTSSTYKSFEFLIYMAKGRFKSNRQKARILKVQAEALANLVRSEIARL